MSLYLGSNKCKLCGAATNTFHKEGCDEILALIVNEYSKFQAALMHQSEHKELTQTPVPSEFSKTSPCVCGATAPRGHTDRCINNLFYKELGSIPSNDDSKETYKQYVKSCLHAPKDKKGKPDWSVFPLDEAEDVLKVFEYGASEERYKQPFTYRNGTGVPLNDLYSATIRHLKEIHKGELYASDSHCLHWAHVAANALMAISALRKVKI